MYPPNLHQFYSIQRELEFDKDCEAFAHNYERLAELDEAIDWVLMRNPTRFVQYDGYYIWRSEKVTNFPAFFIIYQVDEVNRIVNLVGIEEIVEV